MNRLRPLGLVLCLLATLLACKRSHSDGAAATSGSATTLAAPAAISLQDGAGASVASVSGAKASYRALECSVARGGDLSVRCGDTRVKVKARPDGGIKLKIDGGAELKLKLKDDGWKIEDGDDRVLAKIKHKGAGYALEIDADRVANVAIVGGSVEVQDGKGAVLFKGTGLANHPELAVALALPETELTPAQRVAMLAWTAR